MTTAHDRLRTLIDAGADLAAGNALPSLDELLAGPAGGGPLTVAEMADLLGISGHTLRYYERIGLVRVDRDGAGHRRYSRPAIARIMFVTRLRLSGMSIARITEYIGLVEQGAGTEPARLALLRAHRAAVAAQIEELEASLAVIDYKITTYGGTLGSCDTGSIDEGEQQ
ncbi:MerR family transcriptional regulator [Tsukamurella soli]|uniref:MerR family transcriptional regulator n=1 Tax=Tsukamurella soli TaxID=644556 RepID=UPI0031E4F870